MALLQLNEEPSRRSSIWEVAQFFEQATEPMTMQDAFDSLRVFDPGRQRSLAAAFLKECQPGKAYHHLVGSKLRPSINSRGRTSSVFKGLTAIAPKVALIKRSDAFQGMRSIDQSSYSEDLRGAVQNVIALNLVGKAGTAVNRMAIEADHALELAAVKLEAITTVAEERRKMIDELMKVLNRDTSEDENGRRVRLHTARDAAE